tara:strand:+ start:155 stop:346 length:192 start_codon:yes stop_codon:yes gene_type:complete
MSESKGLGDSIEKIARRTKIKNLVDFYKKHHASKGKKKDCGCKNRQEKLNKIFPYKNSKNEDV